MGVLLTAIRSVVPEGRSGDWSVEKFSVTEDEIKVHNLRCMFSPGMGNRTMRPGDYTRLKRGGAVIMSDTPAEMRDLYPFHREAQGNVLINGLGLGMAAKVALGKPEVEHVTVIERSPDVIALVGEHVHQSRRCTVVLGDAYEWQPPMGKRYDAVWHDIWDDICASNLDGMKRLHRRYGRRTEWQGSWCRSLCEMRR